MRRNSERANELVKYLAPLTTYRGRAVSGLDIEKLSGGNARLLPAKDASNEKFLAYFRELEALDYKPGRDADETALRLLARGFPNEQARGPLKAFWCDNISQPAELASLSFDQLMTNPLIRPVMEKIGDALDDAPECGRNDPAGAYLVETPDARRVGFMNHLASLSDGGETPSDSELLLDVMHSQQGPIAPDGKRYERISTYAEIDLADVVAAHMASSLKSAPQLAAEAPLPLLAMAAGFQSAMFRLFSLTAPGFDDRRREIAAAYCSPNMLAILLTGWEPHPDKLGQLIEALPERVRTVLAEASSQSEDEPRN